MRAVRLSSSTPVRRAPGASASGMSPKKCPTPIDGSRTCAPVSTPRRSRASHTPEITRGDVKCALGVEARAEAYSSAVSSWRSFDVADLGNVLERDLILTEDEVTLENIPQVRDIETAPTAHRGRIRFCARLHSQRAFHVASGDFRGVGGSRTPRR